MQLSRLRINLDIIKEIIIMAKQGFATSDRRKIEVITTATHNVESHDCGTVFVLAHAAAAVDCDITLPTIAQAGEGWWCKFVLSAVKDNGAEVAIAADGDTLANMLEVSADGTNNCFGIGGNIITFDGDADLKGDSLELVVANGEWYAYAHSAS
jgi:hypothetical protein